MLKIFTEISCFVLYVQLNYMIVTFVYQLFDSLEMYFVCICVLFYYLWVLVCHFISRA